MDKIKKFFRGICRFFTKYGLLGNIYNYFKSNKFLTRHGFVIAYLLIFIFFFSVQWQFRQSERADIHRLSAERLEQQIGACNQSNVAQEIQISAEIKSSHDFVKALSGDSTDPKTLSRVKSFNKEHDALIKSEHPIRDCSSATVIKFYQRGLHPAAKQ